MRSFTNYSVEPREALIETLRHKGITSDAMGRVPRELFVPPQMRQLAYTDRAQPIGCDQTISQPYIVALMTQPLELCGIESVLEVGTGRGYQAAVLADLARSVISIERFEELAVRATSHVRIE